MCSCFFCDSPCLQRAFMSVLRVSFKVLWNQEGSFFSSSGLWLLGLSLFQSRFTFYLGNSAAFQKRWKNWCLHLRSLPGTAILLYISISSKLQMFEELRRKKQFFSKKPLTWHGPAQQTTHYIQIFLISLGICYVLCCVSSKCKPPGSHLTSRRFVFGFIFSFNTFTKGF